MFFGDFGSLFCSRLLKQIRVFLCKLLILSRRGRVRVLGNPLWQPACQTLAVFSMFFF